MPFDMEHALEHPDAAGWVLGALDPAEAQSFEDHLQSCAECQTVVAEFEAVAVTLGHPAPAAEPPADLEARTVAAVQYAMLAASHPAPAVNRASRWWHLHWSARFVPAVSVLAGAAVAAAGFLGAQLFQSAPAVAATFALSAQPGQAGSATAVARIVHGGYQIQLSLDQLPALRPGQFFECVYVGAGGELVSGGTFATSHGTVTMQSAANPGDFRVIQIRREQPGLGVASAPVILSGTANLS